MKYRPKTVKAAILVEQNHPLVVEEINLPNELLVGQVLVKVELSGICGSQLGEINGVKGPDNYLPHLMGHEGCGKVLDIGPGVKTVDVGDKVVMHWRKGAGIQSAPPIYTLNSKKVNAGWVTTFNTHAIISENRCTRVSNSMSPELASLFGCAITTGFGVVENNAKIKMGESLVVFGAGGVGLNIIQAASLYSAFPIIAVDIVDKRLELARKLGADITFNSQKCDIEHEIKDFLKDTKLNVFIDNTGIPRIIEMGYRLLDSEGRLVLVGVPKKGSNINIYSLPLHFGKTITGSHGGECRPEIDIHRYSRLFKNKNACYKELITERFQLENINDAITSMKDGKSAGRILIEM